MFDISAIDHLSRLACLDLSAEKKAAMTEHLDAFFSLVQAIQAVDTKGVEPLAHPLAVTQDVVLTLQADEVKDTVDVATQQACQRNAPTMAGDLFTVPAVLD